MSNLLSNSRWTTALALVAANLLPLVGVLLFGWDVASLLFLYWLESGVVGFFNVLRMAQAKGPASLAKVVLIPFFLLHFGLFMGGHLALLLGLFGPPRIPALELGLTTAALFASHGFSHMTYYLARGENLTASPVSEMQRPYGRIVVMQLTIISGAFLIMEWGSTTFALPMMIGVKIFIDLVTHNRVHARAQAVRADTT